MQDRVNKKVIIFVLMGILLMMVFLPVLPVYAGQASKGGSSSKLLGWCCGNNKVFRSTLALCSKNKGHFFKNRKAAESYCNTHIAGWCCLSGKVFPLTKGDCLKKKGRFFEDKLFPC